MFIVAGTKSGVGKTVVTLGLMGALKEKGFAVRPFKAGPDYIDPGLHEGVLGVPSYNLDTWMMGTSGVSSTFERVTAGADIGVVEGVMGLFDGRGGVSDEGSTAHIAKTLGLPVVLVVDASSMARSVAAIVKGFTDFDPEVKFLGVIFNRVGSERHAEIIKEAIEEFTDVKILGFIMRDASLALPERHLGLVTRGDIGSSVWKKFTCSAVKAVSSAVDIDYIIKETARPGSRANKQKDRGSLLKPEAAFNKGGGVPIAVARDSAFSFYYRENLEILASLGAEVKFFSPMKDKSLPPGVRGIYLGGGYPELYAEALSANRSMREEIREFSRAGAPVFAECGGLIYLGKRVRSAGNKGFDMAGVFPWTCRMLKRRKALGYRELKAKGGEVFLQEGESVRGHEFHYSEIMGEHSGVGRVFGGYGYLRKRTLASYVHLHFASNPHFAENFIRECEKTIDIRIPQGKVRTK